MQQVKKIDKIDKGFIDSCWNEAEKSNEVLLMLNFVRCWILLESSTVIIVIDVMFQEIGYVI
jgi:hypothetical protein